MNKKLQTTQMFCKYLCWYNGISHNN